jgi:hypothetical protein
VYHVTSSRNRASIQAHGLDWRRMGAASGIAGSPRPELEGCFLALDDWTANYFVDLNNTGGPVDVWAVDGVDPARLETSGEGYQYFPGVIPPSRLRLVRTDVPPMER